MDGWLSNNYPNLDVTNLNEINDISILESAINDNYEKVVIKKVNQFVFIMKDIWKYFDI